MSQYPDFTFEVNQNEFLTTGARQVHAIVTLTATPSAGGSGPAAYTGDTGRENVQVIIIDCSGSMDYPRTKMVAAREATKVAIDTLTEGAYFAIVAGTEGARVVYPAGGRPARVDDRSRREAKDAVSRLSANGGTAMGRWLDQANRIFATRPGAISHAILLTDGKNESEPPEYLSRAIDNARGLFTADCRGIGADWEPAELRRISEALLGSIDIIRDTGGAGLAEDFRQMTANAMGKEVADVVLRVWAPRGAVVRYVKQFSPDLTDLSPMRQATDNPLTFDYPTGSWGAESREYHICVEVEPAATLNVEKLAARVNLVARTAGGDVVLGEDKVRAIWTDDEEKTKRLDPRVAHYTGQAELASVMQEGLKAQAAGDLDLATAKLARAMDIAVAAGNEATAKVLRKVTEIDPVTSKVRAKAKVDQGDLVEGDIASTKTVRAKKS